MPDEVEPTVRTLAFYLPQYHPIAENDEWWGEGFTDWVNVARARPMFPGHYQPHLPGLLGFYDLRLAETRQAQAKLAKAYGVDGFIYYHYWFKGRRLLEGPLDEVLESGEPDFPFCIAWANESWTRSWDGGAKKVLLQQDHSSEDDLTHIRALRSLLTDPRYICFEGRPIILIYRASQVPNVRRMLDTWRTEVKDWGLEGLYLLRIESFETETGDPAQLGFDASVEFQPQNWKLPAPSKLVRCLYTLRFGSNRLSHWYRRYDDFLSRSVDATPRAYVRWPGLTPGFDNSPRRRRYALILLGSSPEKYKLWLLSALEKAKTIAKLDQRSEALVFVNAWNEWAEGNHLEPDRRWGRGYLEAHRSAVQEAESARGLLS